MTTEGKIKNTKTNIYLAFLNNGLTYQDIEDITGAKQVNIYSLVRKSIDDIKAQGNKSITPWEKLTQDEQEILKPYQDQYLTYETQRQPRKQIKTKVTPKKEYTNQQNLQTNKKQKPKEQKPKEQKVKKQKPKEQKPKETSKKEQTTNETKPAFADMIKENKEFKEKFQGEIKQEKVRHVLKDLSRIEPTSADVRYNRYDNEGICKACGGRGWLINKNRKKLTCTHCYGEGKQRGLKVLNADKQELMRELIPNRHYRENAFDAKGLDENVPLLEHQKKASYGRYMTFLQDTLYDLDLGILPNQSYYIGAPEGFGKKHFYYEVIKKLIEQGFKTTGIIDINEIMDNYEDTNGRSKVKEILSADLLLIKLTHMRGDYKHAHVIQYLLDYAGDEGVPIFMFFNYPSNVFLSYGMRFRRNMPETSIVGVHGDKIAHQNLVGIVTHRSRPYNYGQLLEVSISGQEYQQAIRNSYDLNVIDLEQESDYGIIDE